MTYLVVALALSVALNVIFAVAHVRRRRAKRFGATLTVEPFARPMSARVPLHVVRK